MVSRIEPKRYALDGCVGVCSLNARNLPNGAPEAVLSWFESGASADAVAANIKAQYGVTVNPRAVLRHRKNHMVVLGGVHPSEQGTGPIELDNDGAPTSGARKVSDLEILDKIIQAGSRQLNANTVRISPEMTMKAMELRLKLTQGSVFDDFLSAVGSAFGDPPPGPSEAPDAVKAQDEQRQGGTDDDEG